MNGDQNGEIGTQSINHHIKINEQTLIANIEQKSIHFKIGVIS